MEEGHLPETSEIQMRWMATVDWALKLLGHFALASYGVVILTFALGYAVAAAFDPQGRIIDYFFVAPSFGVPLAVGLLFGYQFGWRLSHWSLGSICVPPLAFLVYGLNVSRQNEFPWARVWTKFFGTTSVGEGCYFQFGAQVLATAPLVAALGYAIGAEFGRRKKGETSIQNMRPHAKWRRRAFIGSAFLVIVSLSVIQRFAHRAIELEFEWNAATGFKSASIKNPPASGLLRIIIAPIDRSIILQTRPRIVSEMKGSRLKRVKGCIEPATLWLLPIVLGLDHLSNSSCVVTDRD